MPCDLVFWNDIMIRKIILSAAVVLIGLIIIFAAAWVIKSRVTVVIHNVGDETLQSVVVHVTGNSYPVGDIAAGATRTIKVVSKGESHIEIEHSGRKRLVVGTYFEQGYSGKITVDVTPNQVVNIRDEIRIHPF